MDADAGLSRRAFGRGLAVGVATAALSAAAFAQESQPTDDPSPRFRRRRQEVSGPPDPSRADPAAGGLLEYVKLRSYRWRVTLTLDAPAEAVRDVTAYFAVPIEWPEQAMKFVEEIKPANVRTRPREVAGVGALQIANTSAIGAGKTVDVVRLYELTRYAVRFTPVNDPETLRVPAVVPAAMKTHLGVSPGIETTLPKIVALGKSLRDPEGRPWVTARSYFDWVRRNVRFELGDYRGAQRALEEGIGDCEDMTALFVALCRTSGIPARSVWIEGHAYAEFYLEDPKLKAGCWIPCQPAGPPWFGRMQDSRVLLQKGDRVEDPFRAKPARYLPHAARSVGGRVTITCRHDELDEKGEPVPAEQNLR
jgi:hypothetical protein